MCEIRVAHLVVFYFTVEQVLRGMLGRRLRLLGLSNLFFISRLFAPIVRMQAVVLVNQGLEVVHLDHLTAVSVDAFLDHRVEL